VRVMLYQGLTPSVRVCVHFVLACVCVCVYMYIIFSGISLMFIKISIKYMRVEAVMVISIQIMVFWLVIPCSLFEMEYLYRYQCFGGN
jgi:hypothetical protein